MIIKNLIVDVKVICVVYGKRLHDLFIEHPNSTENPQGYWAHCFFSITNSVTLIWFCLLGIVHSFFPFIFKFNTSSAIIRSFKKLVKSKRHGPELVKYGVPNINLSFTEITGRQPINGVESRQE